MQGMPVPASKTAARPAAPRAARPEPDSVEYPGHQWIAQSVWHGDAVRQATAALVSHFCDRADVLVAMELVVYYQRGDNTTWLRPDVLVALGVGRGNRSSYKVWEEGQAPDFVLEVASPSTAANDAWHKAREYARIGVREYWRLDPEGSLMEAPLEGWAASGGRYDPVESIGCTGRGGHLRSRVLGLDLRCRSRDGATVLVFRDPRTGKEFDGAPEAAERQRRLADKRANAADKRANAAEERANAAESQARQEAGLRRAAEKRVRTLEKRLRGLTAGSPRQPEG